LSLSFREVGYGVGGIELYELGELDAAQLGYSVHPSGSSLVGNSPGDWQGEWIVVGRETACGDPIFLSTKSPHPRLTAMHGQGEWIPKIIAPTLDRFWECLQAFRSFAIGRGSPGEADANPPDDAGIQAYLEEIRRFCNGDVNAVVFWTVSGRDRDEQRHFLAPLMKRAK